MVGVSRKSAAHDFAVDLCAASQGVAQFFEDESTSAFAHHKSVAVFIERARGSKKVIIAGGHGMQSIETTAADRGDGRFGTAGNEEIGFSQTDVGKRIYQGIGGGGTGRDRGEVGAMEVVLHRNMPGGNVGDHFWDEERVETGGPVALAECRHF